MARRSVIHPHTLLLPAIHRWVRHLCFQQRPRPTRRLQLSLYGWHHAARHLISLVHPLLRDPGFHRRQYPTITLLGDLAVKTRCLISTAILAPRIPGASSTVGAAISHHRHDASLSRAIVTAAWPVAVLWRVCALTRIALEGTMMIMMMTPIRYTRSISPVRLIHRSQSAPRSPRKTCSIGPNRSARTADAASNTRP